MMKLHGFPVSPNTWKVRAVAAHIDLPIDFEIVDLTKGAQKTAAFLAINPTGRTPVLVDGDFKLWESTAIMQYISSKTKTDLWPDDARTRADIMRWQSWQLQHWAKGCEPLGFERIVKTFFNMGAPDEAVVAKAEEVFHTEAKMLDAHLGRQSHLVGNGFTLADFSVGSYLFHAERAGMPLQPYKNIRSWFAALAALPAWQQTAPQM